MLLAVAGCTTTRYELAQPTFASVQSTGEPTQLQPRDGISYELRQVENKLVLRFVNGTGKPIELLPTSGITDASGASYPVEAQTLGEGVSGRIVLPPRVEQTGRSAPPPVSEAGSPLDDGVFHVGRVPLDAYQRGPERSFSWPAGSTSTATLRWTIDGREVEHAFVVRRVKG